ncbi:histidine phosphatase family protein [Streptomyces sp. BE303]|uniref:histidine phosphatase family protein n=1 Tax=Streptomyces sp. BE303 TaxID=3002528 RepID=UPI002E7717F1|nr:histidine phosphatase family protein [Streptomyces sp. BE303]MED7951989.1 histidine phosphatase family protein [Streptomyces sp. BE303]
MTVRVIFVAPAIGPELRQARFVGEGSVDEGDPLDAAGVRAARAAAPGLPAAAHRFVSPTARCRRTAEDLGLPDAVDEPALRGCAAGRWSGRTLDEVAADEPAAVMTWLADPAAAPHGGESVRQLCARVGAWLDGTAAALAGRVLVIAEPDVVRAAAVHALGIPDHAFRRLDVPPLAGVELTGRADRWNLRLGLVRPITDGAG